MDSSQDDGQTQSYSQFTCIGAGFSGIALGATLKRWYGISDIRFFERHENLGGTWRANQYPGCACDVPGALYSLSFAPNPDWTRVLPPYWELQAYLERVSDEYGLTPKMTFGVGVERCEWIEETSRWRLTARERATGRVLVHESQFLYSGTGVLVEPRELDVPGAETFGGPIFHSSRWRKDVDLTGKKVVLFGNGCTAAQIVPHIVSRTAHLTQVVRSKHWVLPPIDKPLSSLQRTVFRYVPGALRALRVFLYFFIEHEFRAYYMTSTAIRMRKARRRRAENYMRSTAPAKYHDMIVPDFEVGCKRRIFDAGYLASLHADNLSLTDRPPREIVPGGVIAEDGSLIEADVIVMANGFATKKQFLGGAEVVGRGGKTITEHWNEMGGAEAYNCAALSGFPNFFFLLGPNTVTGHTSTLLAIENAVVYTLRIIKPVLDGKCTAVDVKPEAEARYVEKIQGDLEDRVWASGCTSWYAPEVEKSGEGADAGKKRWNPMTYPYSQIHYWYKCLFPIWDDLQFMGPATEKPGSGLGKKALTMSLFLAGAALAWKKRASFRT